MRAERRSRSAPTGQERRRKSARRSPRMGHTVSMDAAPTEFAATLVADTATTKLDALAIIARAAGGTITDAGTPRVAIALPSGARAVIEIPKFGEPPPLTVDVFSDESLTEARAQADALRQSIAAATGWEVRLLPHRRRSEAPVTGTAEHQPPLDTSPDSSRVRPQL